MTATIHEWCIVHFEYTAIFKWVQKLNAWLFLPSYSLWDWLSISRFFLSQSEVQNRNRCYGDLFTCFFPRFPLFTFVCFEIWLVLCVMWLARWNYHVFGLYEVGFTPIRRLFLWFARYFCVYTERCWNMWIPGFGSDELRPFKKQATTEAHKQVSKRKIYVTVSCLEKNNLSSALTLAILSPFVM